MSDGGGGRARALSKKRCKCVFLLVCVCCFFCMCLFLFVFIFVCVYLCECVSFFMSAKLRCVFSTDRGSRVLSSDNSFYFIFFVHWAPLMKYHQYQHCKQSVLRNSINLKGFLKWILVSLCGQKSLRRAWYILGWASGGGDDGSLDVMETSWSATMEVEATTIGYNTINISLSISISLSITSISCWNLCKKTKA